MSRLAIALCLLGAALVVGFITDWIRHSPRYRAPGQGSQHISMVATLIQGILLGAAVAVLLSHLSP